MFVDKSRVVRLIFPAYMYGYKLCSDKYKWLKHVYSLEWNDFLLENRLRREGDPVMSHPGGPIWIT